MTMLQGRVINAIRGVYRVATDDGEITCSIRGKLFLSDKRGVERRPVAGDVVRIEQEGEKHLITGYDERRTFLRQPPVANADHAVVVVAAAHPEPNLLTIDRILVNLERAGLPVVLALNKCDVGETALLCATYAGTGYTIVKLNALDDVQPLLPHIGGTGITVLTGSSGVGKSTILNALGIERETGDISKWGRGKHTTTDVTLLPYGGGYIADTPGFSYFTIDDIEPQELWRYMPEIRALTPQCDFVGCTHINTKPSVCAVADALARGTLCASRYAGYVAIYHELCEQARKKY